ncbi:hypothetical protein FZZ91_00610 [Synechococcus sp. HB1133]|uniref:hypothetical protein n=2 Tax=Synechococcus TaxID=1129 RepID=UPI00140C400C|nr:hypothetical protein [Synechococcus sp. HB1133]MCB4421338.1 hypothetical protein [Synechococcus sp. HB1133]MCB4431311.1 hypothetical protein [Synechococcus sp. HBA1120]
MLAFPYCMSIIMTGSIEAIVLESICRIDAALSKDDVEITTLKRQLSDMTAKYENMATKYENLLNVYQELKMNYSEKVMEKKERTSQLGDMAKLCKQLKVQLSSKTTECELNLLQLHQVQEELEHYFRLSSDQSQLLKASSNLQARSLALLVAVKK